MVWYKDPLLFFLLIGAAIYALSQWALGQDEAYQIVIGNQDLQRLNDQWFMQMRRPPSEQELAGLVEQFIKEEIYYREAMRLGLDANDTIVRRRMVQKLTFLTEDIATSATFTEADLQTFYNNNLDNYRLADRFSFKHRYFSVDRRADAYKDAGAALLDTQISGDPFMLQREYAMRSEREVGDLFGREFAAQLAALEPGESWQGPLRSAYGWHVVLLINKAPATVQAFADVRERVLNDAQQAARDAANTRYYEELRAQYSIVHADAGS
ncbi:MAG: peptidyl-prolyl cis-trans isomerase [bacterium]